MPQEGRSKVAEPGNGFRFKPVEGSTRRPRATNGGSTSRGDEESACAHKLSNPKLPRKAPVELIAVATVPQTDTGGRGEYPKALERTLPKELGKMTP
jgi:hypothetical protein